MARLCKCYGEDCIEKDLRYPKDELQQIGGKNYCGACYAKKKEDEEQRNYMHL